MPPKSRKKKEKEKENNEIETINIEVEEKEYKEDIFISTIQTIPFKACIDTLNSVFGDVIFNFSKKGIEVIELNHNVEQPVAVYLNIDESKLEEYFCRKDTNLVIKLCRFNDSIKSLNTKHTLNLYHYDGTEELNIVMKSNTQGAECTDTMKLIDLTHDRISFPNLDIYPIIISINSTFFQKTCRSGSSISKNIVFETTNNVFSIKFPKTEKQINRVISLTETSEGVMKFIKNDKPEAIITAKYILKNIIKLSKCTNISDNLIIYMHETFPMVMQYDIGNLGTIKFALMSQ